MARRDDELLPMRRVVGAAINRMRSGRAYVSLRYGGAAHAQSLFIRPWLSTNIGGLHGCT
jgi:hypothetical protein